MSIATIFFVVLLQKTVDFKHYIFNEQNHDAVTIEPQTFVFALLLLQVFSQTAQWLNGPLWSLSVEWMSNLILAFFSIAKNSRYFLSLLLGVIFQFYTLFGGDPWGTQLGRGLFAFTIGAMTRKYLYQNWRNTLFKSISCVAIFLILHILLVYWSPNVIVLAPFVFAFLILNASKVVVILGRFLRLSEFMGKYSYGFYAWHFPLLSLNALILKRLTSQIPLVEGWTIHLIFLATIVLSLSMTYLVIRFIEPKARKLFLPR
jgi:peptidoglycan/LPS O-acetylase OafA/YrhL